MARFISLAVSLIITIFFSATIVAEDTEKENNNFANEIKSQLTIDDSVTIVTIKNSELSGYLRGIYNDSISIRYITNKHTQTLRTIRLDDISSIRSQHMRRKYFYGSKELLPVAGAAVGLAIANRLDRTRHLDNDMYLKRVFLFSAAGVLFGDWFAKAIAKKKKLHVNINNR